MNTPLLPTLVRLSAITAALFLIQLTPRAAAEVAPPFGANVQVRGNLDHSRAKFEREKKGHVAFLGGSITEMEGHRPVVCEFLKQRFPDTAFTFTNAGIASTCSTTGAFRLSRDVLDHGPVDLLFVEFAVNDDQDAHHTREECIRGMEGILRHARLQYPNVDLVVTYFVNEPMMKTYQEGKTPLPIEAHEAVARHYEVSTVNVAKELTEEIAAGKNSWKEYGGVHPGPAGNKFAGAMIGEALQRAWAKPLAANPAAHMLPAPLDALSYFAGRFVEPQAAKIKSGWAVEVPEWKAIGGSSRPRFTSLPMLCSTTPGAEATLDFAGTAIGAFIVAGPDAGVAEASVDGSAFQPVNLFHAYSAGLHYPRTVMLATDLKPGPHTLTLRISEETKKTGHAMRIMAFGVN